MIIVISQPCSDGDEPRSDGGPTIEGPTDGGPTDGESGEPDSGLSATPAFLVIAVLTLITSIFFEYMIHALRPSCELFCKLDCHAVLFFVLNFTSFFVVYTILNFLFQHNYIIIINAT